MAPPALFVTFDERLPVESARIFTSPVTVMDRAMSAGIQDVGVGVLFGLLVGVAMVVALRVAHPHLATEALLEAVGTGLLLILPFAALAATAEILFGWNASQAFSSAGLMTAAAAVGVEAGRRGGGGLRGMLFPAIGAFLLVTAWALTCALAAGVIGT